MPSCISRFSLQFVEGNPNLAKLLSNLSDGYVTSLLCFDKKETSEVIV